MIIVGKKYVSDDLYLVSFCCNLEKCKGACCVIGDAGAPLEEQEISIMEDELEKIKPFMTAQGIKTVDELGVFDYDIHGDFVTPLVNDGECAFVFFENGIAYCAIERAFMGGLIRFRKPVSCHLYPVRITEYDSFVAVNYEKWTVCKPALKLGKKEELPLYVFLKDALIRKYGESWYKDLEDQINIRLNEGSTK
jgi:hypothetical protein